MIDIQDESFQKKLELIIYPLLPYFIFVSTCTDATRVFFNAIVFYYLDSGKNVGMCQHFSLHQKY